MRWVGRERVQEGRVVHCDWRLGLVEGYARYGHTAQEAIYLFEWPVFEPGPETGIGIGMCAGVRIPFGVDFSVFLPLDASWDSDTPRSFFFYGLWEALWYTRTRKEGM